MLRALCVTAVALTCLSLSCWADDFPDLSGTYRCVGKNSDGSAYEGTVVIKRIGAASSATFNLTWDVAGAEYVGVGLLEGNKLSSSWAIPTDDGVVVGVIVYTVEKTRLMGKWTSWPGTGAVMTETLTKK